MKVEISTGYVVVKDYITNKADQEYQTMLFEGYDLGSDQAKKMAEGAEDSFRLNPGAVMRANSERAFALVEQVITVTDGQENEVQKTRQWWDDLNKLDAKKIKDAVDAIADKAIEQTKK